VTPGGKAAALRRLAQAGFTIPSFILCDRGWSRDRILSAIDSAMPGAARFAVRSSAEGEDSAHRSYAGHFYSAIAVTRSDVWNEVQRVLESFEGRQGAAIVQEFIASDRSGVAFSDTGNGLTLVNANFGLCKTVVDGEPCDEYVADRSGRAVSTQIAPEKSVLTLGPDGLHRSESAARVLSPDALARVAALAREVETACGSPQDIEWCFLGDRLYLLQSRPITRRVPAPEEVYYDSANIAESYSGLVLPLTASFAKRVYRIVYTDFLRNSGVPKSQLEAHGEVFSGLLGFFNGRMYYNMNNWYRLAQFVPGYARNKENFERMISSNLRREIAETVPQPLRLKLLYPLILSAKFVAFDRTLRRFKAGVQRRIRKLADVDYATLTLVECQQLYDTLEAEVLSRWYVTLENDFLVMTYLGLLRRIYPGDDLHAALTFRSKATEQVHALRDLGCAAAARPALWDAICRGDVAGFDRHLAEHPELKERYRRYLDTFGGRFANELKLETVGIDEDTAKLLRVLRSYGSLPDHEIPSTQGAIPELPFIRRWAFRLVLSRFRKHAAQRESCRLLRSNMFSIARRLFRRMGAILVERGELEAVDDVFYLELDELLSLSEPVGEGDLRARIARRKRDYRTYGETPTPSHFVARETDAAPSSPGLGEGLSVRGVSPGVVVGRVKVMREFAMPERVDFDILVAGHMDPGWTPLIALSKGLVIEHGGVLSHASIVARELGIPAVIGVRDATTVFSDGQAVELDGTAGTVRAL
jgi:pyruvate,water dikinase